MLQIKNVINFSKKHAILLTVIGVIILSYLSFGKGLDYNFWRDDWTVLWLAKYNLRYYFYQWALPSNHPGEFVNGFPLIYLFGANSFLWQLSGLFLKILASLSLGLALFGLTRSKKIFILSSLFFASYFGGLEAFTWLSARLSAYLIIFFSLALYFYSSSYLENKKIKFLFALVIYFLTALIEPSRGIILLPLFIIWELVERYVNKNLLKPGFIIRSISLGATVLIAFFFTPFGNSFFAKKSTGYLSALLNAKDKWLNFFDSLGQFYVSLFKSPQDWGSLVSQVNKFVVFIGVLSIVMSVVISIKLILSRNKFAAAVSLWTLWIPVFYFPGWVFEMDRIVAVSHRYLAISAVGFAALLVIFISRFKKTNLYMLFGFLILLNLIRSYQIVSLDYQIRGNKIVKPLLEKQNLDIPPGVTGGIFLVTGNHYLRGYVFDWSMDGAIPFALERGLREGNQIPISYIGYDFAGKLVCESNLKRPWIHDWITQLDPVPMSKVYGWNVDDSANLINTTDLTRLKVAEQSSCYSQKVGENLTDDISLSSISSVNNLYELDKQGLSFVGNTDFSTVKQFFVYLDIYNTNGERFISEVFEVKSGKGTYEIPFIFSKYLGSPVKLTIKVKECVTDTCSQIITGKPLDIPVKVTGMGNQPANTK